MSHSFPTRRSSDLWGLIDDAQVQVTYPAMDSEGAQLGAHEKEQIRQLRLLDTNQTQLARLFARPPTFDTALKNRSEEHTSELQSLMRTSYAVICLKNKTNNTSNENRHNIIH